MENKTTEIIFILDRSGSMHGLEKDTIGSFNSLLDKQKHESGKALVSTVLFSGINQVIHDRIPIEEIPPMTEKEYYTGGTTALYDTIGYSVEHIMKIHRYIRKEDLPEHTIFIIITDGMDNASRVYNKALIRKLIEERKSAGWEFMFIGANIDACDTAESIGIKKEMAVDYIPDPTGTNLCYEAIDMVLSDYRSSGTIQKKWKHDIEEDYRSR